MKIEHPKVSLESFVPNATYRLSMNGKALYTAKVVKFHGGCWATVRVVECLYPDFSNSYLPGTEFEIKVAMYNIERVDS